MDSPSNKSAIIFGASGFIGSHVAEQLVLAGYRVTAVLRTTSDSALLESIGAQVVRIDFTSDAQILRCIQDQRLVFNCIANPRVHQSLANHRAIEVLLTGRLVRLSAAAGVVRFVQLSTVQVYGFERPPTPIDENYQGRALHDFTKAAQERETAVRAAADGTAIELTIVRPVNTMGRRDASMKPLLDGHKQGYFVVFGNGRNRWSWIDTRDVGRAMIWLAELPRAAGETWLVKAGDTDWIEVHAALDAVRGSSSRLLCIPLALARPIAGLLEMLVPYRINLSLTRFAVDVMSSQTLFDDNKIRQTGFEIRYSLQDMIAQSVQQESR